MTEHEIREQQKEVMFQAHEAKRLLDALKVKAERTGDLLIAAGKIMKDARTRYSANGEKRPQSS